jgi:hypothetical protein
MTYDDLTRALTDPAWRISSGIYKIMTKGDDGREYVTGFRPNAAQQGFMEALWYRNVILKARQLGYTTLVSILWLDHALWNANQRCCIIAHDRESAETIFRDKVRFAYEHLPEEIRDRFPLARDSAVELLFAHNNSSVRVATSARSGTIHRLHVSEMGKICARYPDKAREVATGSIPAVPDNGIIVIESTAEGREGNFYEMTQAAIKNKASKKRLTPLDYRFHFAAWWEDANYRIDSRSVTLTPEETGYFDEVEARILAEMGRDVRLDADQRAWYATKLRVTFSGREELMTQEYPSFPQEAFQVSTRGNFYAREMMDARRRGAIRDVPVLDEPVNTFWDIGNSDGCAIWFHQMANGEDRFIGYYEAHGEDLRHYAAYLRSTGYLYGTHYLPHDAEHERLSDFNRKTRELLQGLLPGERFVVIPRIRQLMDGIYQVRKHLKGCFFDAARCQLGIARLEGYRKRFSVTDNRYTDQADKSNGCSEGADAFRQWAQAKELGMLSGKGATEYVEAPTMDWRL